MNFFKQAQEFAASANTNTDGDNNSAAQGAAPADDGSAAPGSLPGGRQAPTNQELLQSGQLLFGAARGEKVDPTQLAGAASDLLGGLAQHGNLDEGTYGTYINQAEDYLNKYAGQGQSGTGAAPKPLQADSDQVPTDSQAPPASNESDNVPPPPSRRTADQSDGFQSPADQTADSAPVNAPSTDEYSQDQRPARPSSTDDFAPDQRPDRPSASASDDQYN